MVKRTGLAKFIGNEYYSDCIYEQDGDQITIKHQGQIRGSKITLFNLEKLGIYPIELKNYNHTGETDDRVLVFPCDINLKSSGDVKNNPILIAKIRDMENRIATLQIQLSEANKQLFTGGHKILTQEQLKEDFKFRKNIADSIYVPQKEEK